MKITLSKLTVFIVFMIYLINLPSISGQVVFNGRVTDTIKCQNKIDQSYSLYVPSGYLAKRKWPVILIFDPGGQGVVGVKAFRQAAEKYGYLVACSYNSRNGPLNNNFAAAGFMLDDLIKRFNLDKNRIYAAGFSGGSRFALALASMNNFIAGVIGCGAGLPNDNSFMPAANSSFVYYGIAGTRDMNWSEMFDLMTFFNYKTPVISYLRTFEGGHQWPPPEILTESVEWISLLAMKKKLVTADSAFITLCLGKINRLVNNLISSGDVYDAVRYLQYAVRDFSGDPAAKDLTGLLTKLKQSKDYQKTLRDWSGLAEVEKKMKEEYISSIQSALNRGYLPDSSMQWWKKEIVSLKLRRDKGNPPNSQMSSRLLNFISILCSEQGTELYHQNQNALSGFFFELCTMSDSENPNNYYNLARALSLLNKKLQSIDALNKAVDHGFTSKKTIEKEAAFNNIRSEEKFRLLMTRVN